MHAVDVLPTLVAAATGLRGADLLVQSMAAAGRPLDGTDVPSIVHMLGDLLS